MVDPDIAETLRGMAEGRLMLNVRHGIATPAGLLVKAADEIERLREVVRQRTKLLDDQLGTPCEQIRHEQDVERLRQQVDDARHDMCERHEAEIERLRAEIEVYKAAGRLPNAHPRGSG